MPFNEGPQRHFHHKCRLQTTSRMLEKNLEAGEGRQLVLRQAGENDDILHEGEKSIKLISLNKNENIMYICVTTLNYYALVSFQSSSQCTMSLHIHADTGDHVRNCYCRDRHKNL